MGLSCKQGAGTQKLTMLCFNKCVEKSKIKDRAHFQCMSLRNVGTLKSDLLSSILANFKHWSTNNYHWLLLEEKSQWISIVAVIRQEKMKKMGTIRGVRLGLPLRNIWKQIQYVPRHVEYSQATKTSDEKILLNGSNLFFRTHSLVP